MLASFLFAPGIILTTDSIYQQKDSARFLPNSCLDELALVLCRDMIHRRSLFSSHIKLLNAFQAPTSTTLSAEGDKRIAQLEEENQQLKKGMTISINVTQIQDNNYSYFD